MLAVETANHARHATADVTAVLSPTDGGTEVSIDSDITITGRIVQFGRGVILDVSAKLIQQFVDCLEDKLSSGALVPEGPPA